MEDQTFSVDARRGNGIEHLMINIVNSYATPKFFLHCSHYKFQVTYIEPGQSSVIEARNGSTVRVQATPGPVLGPPWQRPENG